jgi:uncharacterized protein
MKEGMIKIEARTVKSITQKVLGLIGKDKAYNLLLKTHFGIHTFGVKVPIDVVILNNQNVVVKIKKNLKPNRVFLWNPVYERVLELPEGTIAKNKIKNGGKIDLITS